MKTFQFSLKRMQNYKVQLLEKEKNALARLRKRVQELENQRDALICYRRNARWEIQEKQLHGITIKELSAYQFYDENIKHQLKALAVMILEAVEDAERQLKNVVAASQEVSALDKLEERQLEEYQVLVSKDNEKIIAEFVSTQVIRKMSENAG